VVVKPATVVGWHRPTTPSASSASTGDASFTSPSPSIRRPSGPPSRSSRPVRSWRPGDSYSATTTRSTGSTSKIRVDKLGLTQVKTAYRSPWQNPFAERWIEGLRRDCLDHIIAINEDQLRRVVRAYVDHFHQDRTHLGLEKDTPVPRAAEPPEKGKIVAFPRVGGLHHRHSRTEKTAA
jgi:hypothetical protein